MSNSDYISVTDTAKLLRQALKAQFPGVKFSIRSSRYAGGASIDVSWTDGPPASAVDATCYLYRGATFDGMQDLKEYHSSILAGPDGVPREVHFGADYIFTNRHLSPALLDQYAAGIKDNGLARGEQCRSCGNWMDGTCYTARGQRADSIDFVCSPACGAKVEARWGHEVAR